MTNSIYSCDICQQHFCNCFIPKRKTGIIKIIKNILNKSSDYHPTQADFIKVKNILQNHINVDNMSPYDINILYNLNYGKSTMAVHISKTFGIKLKSAKDGYINYLNKNNLSKTNERDIYWRDCQFKFSPYQEPNIIGFELLDKYSFSQPQNKEPNKTYLHRDHMVSISFGYENNIPPEHISHPANCEILTEKDNITKGSGSSITYDQLLDRINNWDTKLSTLIKSINISKTESHKNKLSIKNKGKQIYNDGIKHFTVYAGEEIDPRWIKGYLPNTKKKYFWFNDGVKNYRIYDLSKVDSSLKRGTILSSIRGSNK